MQQSPDRGLNIFLHLLHGWKNWQASVGMVRLSAKPQYGHTNIEVVLVVMARLLSLWFLPVHGVLILSFSAQGPS